MKAKPSERDPSAAVRPLEILIVDDHEHSSVAVSISLERAGCRCSRAANMADALASIARITPDVVILERSLGRSVGTGVARELRHVSGVETLRVIVVSSQPEPDGFCETEQVDEYLVKPVMSAELMRAITR